MNPNDLKVVLEALQQADVREFSLKTSDYDLSIRRGPQDVAPVQPLLQPRVAAVPSAAEGAPSSEPAPSVPSTAPATPAPAPAASASAGTPVKAPIVGTFYASPSPDQPPYVRVGDRVTVGQTLCILEAMKLMNEIESEVAGTVLEVRVGNSEPVEYGQVLFVIG